MIDVRSFTVGPIQENAYFLRASATAERALLVDPGEEPERLLAAAEQLGTTVEAILITHCHFDHVGAVAPLARATGAPVYCPQLETGILADIVTLPGFGPYEGWQAEHTLAGGERLTLAGMDIEVLFTPGHSPGHLTYAITPAPAGAEQDAAAAEAPALLSGDVLFQGSVGRTDFPGSDWPTLERSIAMLMERFPRETTVYPGHMALTTLGREWDTNPFLSELRAGAAAG